MNKNPFVLILGFVLIVLIGVIVSIAGGDNGQRLTLAVDDSNNAKVIAIFTFCGVVAFAINWLSFIPAAIFKTEKYYDLIGSITYLSLIFIAFIFSDGHDLRTIVVAIMVIAWALRLGSFLFVRVLNNGHDDRFDEVKIDPLKFLLAWTLQAFWVLVTAACALVIITSSNKQEMGLIGVIGCGIWVVGFIFEVVADQQKRAFRKNTENKNRFITSGLWAWSQHPNYFGEIILWFGMALVALPVLVGWQWLTLISPFFVLLLLTKGSGIPTLKEKSEDRWGKEAVYQQYITNTPVLFPKKPKA